MKVDELKMQRVLAQKQKDREAQIAQEMKELEEQKIVSFIYILSISVLVRNNKRLLGSRIRDATLGRRSRIGSERILAVLVWFNFKYKHTCV